MVATSRLAALADRYGTHTLLPVAIRDGWSATEFETRSLERMRHKVVGVKLARVFEAMPHGLMDLDGYEDEMLREWSGTDFPNRLHIPWHELERRDLNVAAGTAGGYLAAVDTLPAADILRPWSVVARAGVTILEGQIGPVTLPKTTATTTIQWQSTESTQASTSQPTIAQLAATPKIAIGVIQFSRQLNKQANVEAYIRRELLRTAGTAIDRAVLAGSGASGQPLGVINTAGIGTQSGTSLDHAGVIAMRDAVAAANARDEAIAFVADVATRTLLSARVVGTDTGRFVWDNDRVASRPGYVTTDMPAATMIAGDWSSVLVPLWGSGVVIEFNPFDSTLFRSGVIQARVLVACDVMVVHPAAFSVASSIT